jgi:hypothetical protein
MALHISEALNAAKRANTLRPENAARLRKRNRGR